MACVLMLAATAVPADRHATSWLTGLPKEDKLVYANLAMAGAITAWGIANWDYGDRAPHASSEGWFARDTKEGGADKLGHAYGSYVFSHALTWLYGEWGYEREDAARYGALSALGLQAMMEVGDSFSSYGFSWEDMAMNVLGVGAGYLLWTHPDLARKVDLRIEYAPHFDTADVFTDYEHQKYLVAVKLDGFDGMHDSPLGYLELHLGYYARGYSKNVPELTSRNVYVGVAVNLSRLLDEAGWHKASTITRYYQVPHTSLQFSKNLNR